MNSTEDGTQKGENVAEHRQRHIADEMEKREKEIDQRFEKEQIGKAETSRLRLVRLLHRLKARIGQDAKSFRVYRILRILVILTMVRSFVTGSYENAALCLLSLILFLLPAFFEENLHIVIPNPFEITIYFFIYAAEILGEINHYYTMIPGWDTMLHTLNGFLCAAVGFSLVDILNQKSQKFHLSAGYLALVAFCFSMTIGVCWEFIEFTMDQLFQLDMQKDYIVKTIGSVTLDPTHSQIPIKVSNITKTVIYTASGKTVTVHGGYLDIGIIDTMKDLLVNFVGALAFSIFGFLYLSGKDRKRAGIGNAIVDGLILHRADEPPAAEMVEEEEEAEEKEDETMTDFMRGKAKAESVVGRSEEKPETAASGRPEEKPEATASGRPEEKPETTASGRQSEPGEMKTSGASAHNKA